MCRSPQEYTGERTRMPDYPEEGALRRAGTSRRRCRSRGPRRAEDSGRLPQPRRTGRAVRASRPRDDETIVYCRIGERSSHTWFVLDPSAGPARMCATTTDPGPSGAMPCAYRSPSATEPDRHPRRHRAMPAALAEVVGEFQEVNGQDKLQLLLEFANDLPELPSHLEEAAMEPVPECAVTAVPRRRRHRPRPCASCSLSASAEAPTTRGFAARSSAAGLDGQSAADILAVPDDFYADLGLAALISPRCGCAGCRRDAGAGSSGGYARTESRPRRSPMLSVTPRVVAGVSVARCRAAIAADPRQNGQLAS